MIAFLEQTKTTVNKNQYCICPGRHRAGIDWEGCEGPFYGGGSVVYFDGVVYMAVCVCPNPKKEWYTQDLYIFLDQCLQL